MAEIPHPSPEQIKAARLAAGHTQQKAAETVHPAESSRWRKWESGRHRMDAAVWELYCIKTGYVPKVKSP